MESKFWILQNKRQINRINKGSEFHMAFGLLKTVSNQNHQLMGTLSSIFLISDVRPIFCPSLLGHYFILFKGVNEDNY